MTIEQILQGVKLRQRASGRFGESASAGIGVRLAARASRDFCFSRFPEREPTAASLPQQAIDKGAVAR